MAGFPIVGIGSSAGGLEALRKLFGAMPTDSGLAFVVAAHLDPTQKSHLAELLGRCTEMPVVQIEDAVETQPDHVYVIAPDQELTIEGGVIRAHRPRAPRGQRHPVDSFFRSLAEDQGERAIAIVLSGTGTDGSLGLRFIKAEGGIAIAQDPETAGFEGMPLSAIGTGTVDLVLPPEKMPEALQGLATHPYVRAPAEAIEQATPDEQLRDLLTLVHARTRQDFSGYKKRTLVRRIHRRMGLHHIDGLEAYTERLRDDLDEVRALAADLTINVTGFFRDPQAWETLAEKVIAPLIRERPADSTIRIWVPGCSTGEEAYSIAILVTEQAEALGKTFDFKLFATDVSQGMLPFARAGRYPGSIALDVGEDRLQRFFEMHEDTWCISKALRETITFAPQSLLQDPPFSHLDLISCRNLLIYLEPDAQKRVLGMFHFALREHGHLFLGTAETTAGQEDFFEPVSKTWRIFRRIGPTRYDLVDFPIVASSKTTSGSSLEPASPDPRSAARETLDQALIERHAPASVLVDQRHRVHYTRGPTEEYLRHPGGVPTRDLLAIVRPGLRTPLRLALRRALDERREVSVNAHVRRRTASHPVRLVVTPLKPGAEGPGRLMVSFFGREATVAEAAASEAAPAEPEQGRNGAYMQAELDNTRADLRHSIEQMEAANEELQASNEEIRSINEELQASNEELETSKEELQSLNEEANTVNNQLQAKVGELERRTDDLDNLLNGSDVATLFLDRSLCIRWFTPTMRSLLELLPTDLGRPISHFAQRFTGGDLLGDARTVLERLLPSDAEVVDDLGRCYLRRILPYRTSQDRIDGVVVTFIDITERKEREKEVEEAREVEAAREFAESIVDTIREPLVILTPDLKVRSANEAFYRNFRVSREETKERPLFELGNWQWDIPELRRLLEEVLPADRQFSDFKVEHEFEQIGRRTMLLNGRRLDHVQLILLAIEDVTERDRAEAAVRASEARLRKVLETGAVGVLFFDRSGTLVDANDVFLGMTGHARSEVEARELSRRAMTPPEWVEVSEEQMKGLETTGRIGPYEKEYFCKDGSRSWMLFAGADLGDGTIVEFCIDIGARKRAETALQESEERFRQFAENSTDVLWIADAHTGRLEYLSPAYGEVWGEPRDAVMANLDHWLELIHPDDRDMARQRMPRMIAGGEQVVTEYRIIRPNDGEVRWIRDSGFPIPDHEGNVRRVAGIARDVTAPKRADEERELLSHELSHRVKNILAVVQSLAMQTDRRIDSVAAFREAFIGRLQAMARAHGLLLDARWRSADLQTLVERTVQAYRVDRPDVLEVEGEPVTLTPKQGLGLSLVLHELGTNAAKYGALSQHEGRLRISWRVEDGNPGTRVRLTWQERHGPTVEVPRNKGFGTQLIERATQYELDGEAELHYAPDGLTCELLFPLSRGTRHGR